VHFVNPTAIKPRLALFQSFVGLRVAISYSCLRRMTIATIQKTGLDFSHLATAKEATFRYRGPGKPIPSFVPPKQDFK
jgi:hypothetical protein